MEVAAKPFDSPDFLFEWKVDGFRCVLFYVRGKVRLQSKTGRECTGTFPELLSPQLTGEKAILDGEITVLTQGKPDFEGVMGRYLAAPGNASALAAKKQAFYIVWDIIWHDGKSLVNLPLVKRKEILNQVLDNSSSVTKIDWIDNKGLFLWQAVKDHGLEGMVCKRKNSRYEFRRSSAWLKIKNYHEVVVNVLGYKQKDGSVLIGTAERIQGHAIGMGKT